jgi:hypothetical protein
VGGFWEGFLAGLGGGGGGGWGTLVGLWGGFGGWGVKGGFEGGELWVGDGGKLWGVLGSVGYGFGIGGWGWLRVFLWRAPRFRLDRG